MRVEPVNKAELEERLFYFLQSVSKGRPVAESPLVAKNITLKALYTNPHPDLVSSVRHNLDVFLVSLGTDPASWGEIRVPASVFGLVMVFHNCLFYSGLFPYKQRDSASTSTKDIEENQTSLDSVRIFTEELASTLPLAGNRDSSFIYHTVLQHAGALINNSDAPKWMDMLLHGLIEINPLTALWSLDAHTPNALSEFAPKMLPGWKHEVSSGNSIRQNSKDWINMVSALLSDKYISRYLRHRWLSMPENRSSCRNIGLILEILRNRGKHREFILEFYEAYDYFNSETRENSYLEKERIWPIIETIEQLLRFPGDNDEALRVNRFGNEYFLKFRPFLEILEEENGIPSEYHYLTRTFYRALRPLVDFATFGEKRGLNFGDTEFVCS
ncbi:hypothetical protein QUF76_02755 [Desulfobacterales bacterium HSG16]|nr:hypothetical protein [Desulfobacterales bacterium HSG16]